MKKVKICLVSLFLSGCCTVTLTVDENPPSDLEKRVETLEQKLNLLLQALQEAEHSAASSLRKTECPERGLNYGSREDQGI